MGYRAWKIKMTTSVRGGSVAAIKPPFQMCPHKRGQMKQNKKYNEMTSVFSPLDQFY